MYNLTTDYRCYKLPKKDTSVHDSIFRDYDIRGNVGSELILENIYALGCAIASYFLVSRSTVKTVVLGWDDGEHSLCIAQELTRAFTSSGLDVIHSGVCPTPVMYFSLHVLPVEAGVMVTTSQSKVGHVSIKLCLGKQPVWGQQIAQIKMLYQQQSKHNTLYAGTVSVYPMVKRYIHWLARQFTSIKSKTPMCSIDCSQSTAALVFPHLVKLLKWSSQSILESTASERQQQSSSAWKLAFDADADRLKVLTPIGPVAGDKLFALFAQDILQRVPGSLLVYDANCSPLIAQLIQKWGGTSMSVYSGTACIKQLLQEKQGIFAGKLSGHFLFNDHYFGYDDGIYAALRLCELMLVRQKTVDELLAQLPPFISTPEMRITCSQEIQEKVLQDTYQFFAARSDTQVCTKDGIRAITPYGWAHVKKSSTQPLLYLRFEAFTHEGLTHMKQEFYTVLKNSLDTQSLALLDTHEQ